MRRRRNVGDIEKDGSQGDWRNSVEYVVSINITKNSCTIRLTIRVDSPDVDLDLSGPFSDNAVCPAGTILQSLQFHEVVDGAIKAKHVESSVDEKMREPSWRSLRVQISMLDRIAAASDLAVILHDDVISCPSLSACTRPRLWSQFGGSSMICLPITIIRLP